jgi:hypothetical protein
MARWKGWFDEKSAMLTLFWLFADWDILGAISSTSPSLRISVIFTGTCRRLASTLSLRHARKIDPVV